MNKKTSAGNQDLVRERFTKTAEVFGNFAVATRGVEAATLAEFISPDKKQTAIDIACGSGTLALRFAPLVKWAYGVDLTPAILRRAKASALADGISNLDFAISDAHRLPFADRSIDIAVTSYALHHMPDAARVIGEMTRVVRPGGRVGVIDIRVEEKAEVGELNNRIERVRDPSHTRTLRRSEFEELFAANRLRVTGADIQQNTRQFDHWLHVAGWHRGDAPYQQARRLMESTIENDGAGFHPRIEPAQPGALPELMITNTILIMAGEKF